MARIGDAMWRDRVVCISAYNEADSIVALVDALHALDFDVIVIDAQSTDDTMALATNAGARVIQHAPGIGPCLTAGWQYALESNYKYIGQIDAGGSHNPMDLLHLFNALYLGYDMAIGSRFIRGARYNGRPLRAMLSRLAAAACNLAQPGAAWHDWTSGLRVFRADTIRLLLAYDYRSTMHGWQIEVLARAGAMGLEIAEVPISYRAGRSSFNRHVASEAFYAWLHLMNHVAPRKVTA
jgi:dolichol-phosphate mannosyltransferase